MARAVSAETKPVVYIHPKALEALREIMIQLEDRSKLEEEFPDAESDLIVMVCDSAAEECPVWLGKGMCVHHSFPDPALTRPSCMNSKNIAQWASKNASTDQSPCSHH